MPAKPTRSSRKRRSDADTTDFTERDLYLLTWMGQQYTMRLDHLRWLMGIYAGLDEPMSEGAARNLVTRWEKAGWVHTKRIRAYEPFWIWPTGAALRKVGLPYPYRNIEQTSLDDLRHLAAINEVRLQHCEGDDAIQWISERQLLQGIKREKDKDLIHRPDAEMHWQGVGIVAIEVELSLKKAPALRENLMELIRGEEYLQLKTDYGAGAAKRMSFTEKSQYTEIWYFGPPKIRKQVRRERARLISQDALTEEEAYRLFVLWYPVSTDDQRAQEDQEENEARNLALDDYSIEIDQDDNDEETRPEPEGHEGE